MNSGLDLDNVLTDAMDKANDRYNDLEHLSAVRNADERQVWVSACRRCECDCCEALRRNSGGRE